MSNTQPLPTQPSNVPAPAQPYRSQPWSRPETFRHIFQYVYLLFYCWIGWRFFLWVTTIQSTGRAPFDRPAAVDGFLPISGLAGLRFWLESAQLHPVHPAAALILVAAVLTGVLLKRGFCSWICPVFTLSEQLWRLGARLFGRNFTPPFWLDLILRSLKYLLLFFFFWQIAVRMPLSELNLFLSGPYHQSADVSMLRFFLSPSLIFLTFCAFFLVLSLFIQNPWCRYLCPYGALLGLVSLFSLTRIYRNPRHCVRCGACSSRCPAWLPVMIKTKVRSAECFACYRCVQGCPAPKALQMRFAGRWSLTAPLFGLFLLILFLSTSIYGRSIDRWQGHASMEAVRSIPVFR